MRRLQLGLVTMALPVLMFCLFVAGCGKDDKKSGSGSGDVKKEEKKQASGPLKVLEPKGGVLKGKITLAGSAPIDPLNKDIKAQINAHEKKDYCLSAKDASETTQQAYRIGDNKQLGNVFVWIKPVAGTFFKVTKDQLDEAKKHKIVFRQPHCAFIPHSAILFAEYYPDPTKPRTKERTGQTLEILNDAEITHNTGLKGTKNNVPNVIIEPKKGKPVDTLVAEETFVEIKCDIHKWMDAYLRVVDTPYYAISRSDNLDKPDKVAASDPTFGTFEIKNLPVGKVKVFARHERAGWISQGESKGQEIDIKEGAPTEITLVAEPK